MGIKYLWDTNTAIYYLQQQFPLQAEQFIDDLIAEGSLPCISAISEIELLCWRSASEKDMKLLQDFIDDALVIELERTIKYKTADIRKKYRLKLPDAIIAATALDHKLTLITRNVKDFHQVEGLDVIDPWTK